MGGVEVGVDTSNGGSDKFLLDERSPRIREEKVRGVVSSSNLNGRNRCIYDSKYLLLQEQNS